MKIIMEDSDGQEDEMPSAKAVGHNGSVTDGKTLLEEVRFLDLLVLFFILYLCIKI